MHLRRLYIRGFRSIHELNLEFTPSKNVIIGRNNAGKSNIIHALNIVLGETAPAWERSENITEADFYSSREADGEGKLIEKTEDTLFIWCELQRKTGEDLDWSEIDQCFWVQLLRDTPSEIRGWYSHPDRAERSSHRLVVVGRAR